MKYPSPRSDWARRHPTATPDSLRLTWKALALTAREHLVEGRGLTLPGLGRFLCCPATDSRTGRTSVLNRPFFELQSGARFSGVPRQVPRLQPAWKDADGGPVSRHGVANALAYGAVAERAQKLAEQKDPSQHGRPLAQLCGDRALCSSSLGEILRRAAAALLSAAGASSGSRPVSAAVVAPRPTSAAFSASADKPAALGPRLRLTLPGVGSILTNDAGRVAFRYADDLLADVRAAQADIAAPAADGAGAPAAQDAIPATDLPLAAALAAIRRRCIVADPPRSGCVPRVHFEAWLAHQARPALRRLSAGALLGLLDGNSFGKTGQLVRYDPLLKGFAALASGDLTASAAELPRPAAAAAVLAAAPVAPASAVEPAVASEVPAPEAHAPTPEPVVATAAAEAVAALLAAVPPAPAAPPGPVAPPPPVAPVPATAAFLATADAAAPDPAPSATPATGIRPVSSGPRFPWMVPEDDGARAPFPHDSVAVGEYFAPPSCTRTSTGPRPDRSEIDAFNRTHFHRLYQSRGWAEGGGWRTVAASGAKDVFGGSLAPAVTPKPGAEPLTAEAASVTSAASGVRAARPASAAALDRQVEAKARNAADAKARDAAETAARVAADEAAVANEAAAARERKAAAAREMRAAWAAQIAARAALQERQRAAEGAWPFAETGGADGKLALLSQPAYRPLPQPRRPLLKKMIGAA